MSTRVDQVRPRPATTVKAIHGSFRPAGLRRTEKGHEQEARDYGAAGAREGTRKGTLRNPAITRGVGRPRRSTGRKRTVSRLVLGSYRPRARGEPPGRS